MATALNSRRGRQDLAASFYGGSATERVSSPLSRGWAQTFSPRKDKMGAMKHSRPLFWESSTLEILPHERLAAMRPDWHVRRRNGRHLAFLCEDIHGEHLLCSQKLCLMADHINKLAKSGAERITVPSLYNVLWARDGKLNHGWSKHRWRVVAHPLEEIADAFESARKGYQKSTVLGSRQCIEKRRVLA